MPPTPRRGSTIGKQDRDIVQAREEVGDETRKAVAFARQNLIDFREDLSTHHKVAFTGLIFFGVVLIWYGLWFLVSEIPFLKNPIVATGLGLLILFLTGYYYKGLV
ncbi:MAG: hypothetical protein ACLFUV_08520 [Methanomassiliicoccales archaeon]